MTLQPVTFYQHVCDCCGEVADYGDFAAWSDPTTAGDQYPDDWANVGDEDLCSDCWEWPDDTADDDDQVRAHETHPKAAEATA